MTAALTGPPQNLIFSITIQTEAGKESQKINLGVKADEIWMGADIHCQGSGIT